MNPVENEDVYRRHSDCRCSVEYDPGGAKRFQNVHNNEWKTAEERAKIEERKQVGSTSSTYIRPGVKKVLNSELSNGLPIHAEANDVLDKVDDLGNVLQRRVYGADGLAIVDFDTGDHGLPHQHPTGAHKHVFNHQKRNPHGPPLALTEQELRENADIIQRGVNYRDPQ